MFHCKYSIVSLLDFSCFEQISVVVVPVILGAWPLQPYLGCFFLTSPLFFDRIINVLFFTRFHIFRFVLLQLCFTYIMKY